MGDGRQPAWPECGRPVIIPGFHGLGTVIRTVKDGFIVRRGTREQGRVAMEEASHGGWSGSCWCL